MRLLEHPAVLAKRRELDAAVAAGRLVDYRGLRWVADGGLGELHWSAVLVHPINFIKITLELAS